MAALSAGVDNAAAALTSRTQQLVEDTRVSRHGVVWCGVFVGEGMECADFCCCVALHLL